MTIASYQIGLRTIVKGGPYLVLAGLPGLARLVMLSCLAFVLGLEAAGTISSDLSVLYFLGFATSAGWATRLISRGTPTGPYDMSQLASHVLGSALTALLFSPILFVLPISHLAPSGMIVMLIGHGIYQSVRGAAVAARRWKTATAYDLAVHLIPFAAFAAAPQDSEALFLTVMTLTMIIGGLAEAALLVGGATRLLSFHNGASIVAEMRLEAPKSLLLGLAMLVTTGLMFSFVPFVLKIGSGADASITALMVNCLAALALLPRALTYRYLPLIGKELSDSAAQDGPALRRFIQWSHALGLAISAASVAVLIAAALLLDGPVLVLIAGLILGATIPILVTGEIHYLVAAGESRKLLLVNVISSVPYVVAVLVLTGHFSLLADDVQSAGIVSASFVGGALARSAWFRILFRRRLET